MALIKGKQIADNSISFAKLPTVDAAKLLLGNATGEISAVALSGHATITAAGVLSIADDAISTSKLANSAVTLEKIAADAFSTDLTTGTLTGKIAEAAAVKTYVDSVAQGLDVKQSVRVATTGSMDLHSFEYADSELTESSPAISNLQVDGVSLAIGNRVLVKDRNLNGYENGIYEVTQAGNGSTTPWVLIRASDFNSTSDITPGAFCFIEQGSVNADTGYVLSTNGPITLDSTALTFTQFSAAGVVEAGAGLLKEGNTISLNIDSLSETLYFQEQEANRLNPEQDYLLYSDNGIEKKIRVDNFFRSNLSSWSYLGSAFPHSPLKWAASAEGGPGLTFSLNDQITPFGTDQSADDCLTIRLKGESLKLSDDASNKKAIEAPVPRLQTSTLAAAVTATASTGISITKTPAADQAPILFVNGVKVTLGVSTNSGIDAFFKSSAGVARTTLAAIEATDVLWWASADYNLEIGDVLEISYTAFA